MTTELATLANGCFWCTEAVFQRLHGVAQVVSGYTGGSVADPTYEQVCSGTTGHAEAVQVSFDPEVISYRDVLDVFFSSHDPTTLNRQGPDVGTQYRSAIYYSGSQQRETAEQAKLSVDESGAYPTKTVTEIEPLGEFFPAEDYHFDFYERNRESPYCRAIIDPKVQKLYKDFSDKLSG